jgi:ATP-dependent Lhr-like helicase
VAAREIAVEVRDPATPSPFASASLFGFVANYIYEGDAPLAERRAQALAIDPAQLRELLGDAELRELLDAGSLAELEVELQRLDESLRAKSVDAVHDLLLRLGDLSRDDLRARTNPGLADEALSTLLVARRAVAIDLRGEQRFIAVEHASRYRDGAHVALPPGIPDAFLTRVADPVGDLLLRHARSHGPFGADEVAARFELPRPHAEEALRRLVHAGRLAEGAFRPGGMHREWCDPEVLQRLRRRSLAKLRREVEPVEPRVLARFACAWQGVSRRTRGLDALLDVIERLQGAALPASILESEILPARIDAYAPADLDALAAAGEVIWCGVESVAERDGRIALYLADSLPKLRRPVEDVGGLPALEARILEVLAAQGASFFAAIQAAAGGGFPRDTLDALWSLVWRGLVTNDSFHVLRAYCVPQSTAVRVARRRAVSHGRFRSRRVVPPAAEGRWALLDSRAQPAPSATEHAAALTQQLLSRHGIVTREVANHEGVTGGFRAMYEVLQALEAGGRIRRGYFVGGVGATQFALPTALDLLRRLRHLPDAPEVVTLAATDPANPYGALLRWPADTTLDAIGVRRAARAVGARVVLVNGALAAWLGRGGKQLLTWLPEDEDEHAHTASAIAHELARLARRGVGFVLGEIDGVPARRHPLALHLTSAGFVASQQGFHLRAGAEAAAEETRPEA